MAIRKSSQWEKRSCNWSEMGPTSRCLEDESIDYNTWFFTTGDIYGLLSRAIEMLHVALHVVRQTRGVDSSIRFDHQDTVNMVWWVGVGRGRLYGTTHLLTLTKNGDFSMQSGGLFRLEFTECLMKHRNWLPSSTQMIKICWWQVRIAWRNPDRT